MNIEELKEKHSEIFWMDDVSNTINIRLHTKLSVEFAISVLEDLKFRFEIMSDMSTATHGYRFLQNKIQELKQYLDEKV